MTFLYTLGIILIVFSLTAFMFGVLEDENDPYPLCYSYGDVSLLVFFITGWLCVLIYLFS